MDIRRPFRHNILYLKLKKHWGEKGYNGINISRSFEISLQPFSVIAPKEELCQGVTI